ncbi:MAG: HipA N-terminal domain-containing protein, partial [Usitatibacter sp.]
MKTVVGVYLGESAVPVGDLTFVADRGKEACQFAYATSWLESADRFEIDPALPLSPGHHFPQGKAVLFGCFMDCAPDGWGEMVINRDRRKRGVTTPATSLDMLLEIHDGSRMGALRFSADRGKTFLADPGPDARKAPPLIELKDLLRAATAIDKDTETADDLRLLLRR